MTSPRHKQISIEDYIIDDDNTNDLELFRQNWLNEMKQKKKTTSGTTSSTGASQMSCKQIEADKFYLTGIKHEKAGKMDKAVSCYRRALKCDENVEARIRSYDNTMKEIQPGTSQSDIGEIPEYEEDLVDQLSAFSIDQSDRANLVNLPTEVLLIIFRHVISKHLDLTSYCNLARTCRRLYVIANDVTLCKLMCSQAFNTPAKLLRGNKDTFLKMLKHEAYPRTDGCYMSKVSYFREGDPTVMSPYYSPFQCVVYYRYIRFFPDGSLYYVTTNAEPEMVVPKLTSLANFSSPNYQVRCGKYTVTKKPCATRSEGKENAEFLEEEEETCVQMLLKKHEPVIVTSESSSHRGRRRRNDDLKYVITEAEFQLELALSPHRKKRSNKLKWRESVVRMTFDPVNPRVVEDKLDLSNQHPPFFFRKVASYCSYSVGAV